MLLYEYKCALCKKRFEAYAPMTERDVPQTSPCCGATSRRVFAAPSAVHVEFAGFREGYSAALDRHIGSKHELNEELKKCSEEYFSNTGIPMNFILKD